jgi:NosR/NirI family nitrous oxide reductase transcriptional regulator
MLELVRKYVRWLHTGWPAGTVEPLPEVASDGSTAVPGLYVVGDLSGVPLLKLAADGGARVVQRIGADPKFAAGREHGAVDVAILGASVAGMAAALEARKAGLTFVVLEANEPFSTLVNFPARKPIFLYPTSLKPAGELALTADVKEALVDELREQTRDIEVKRARAERVERVGGALEVVLEGGEHVRAQRVVVAIGRSGAYRKLGAPGEELPHVFNRLHDPADYAGKDVLVVGGGDTALETAAALAGGGARVTLSYRGAEFSRAKPESVAALQAQANVRVLLESKVTRIEGDAVELTTSAGAAERVPAEVVFPMLGREPPLDFFRRSGVPIRGEWRTSTKLSFAAFVAFCAFLYLWKADKFKAAFDARGWFPYGMGAGLKSWAASASDPASFLGALAITLNEPGFYYSLAYCVCVVLFGFARMRKRPTPYVRVQTWCLMAIQVVPLFLLPYLALPLAGHNGAFDDGWGKGLADALFPSAGYGHGREYWRAFGLVLAWPLFIWNVFTSEPLWAWLAISLVQTFVLIPLIVWRWGKGAYCSWICSCGALAETLGDAYRTKMPHGPRWNRLNVVGQVVLVLAFAIFALRAFAWSWPESAVGRVFASAAGALTSGYYHVVDLGLAGIVGVGFYFWFSGRVWCRFACPLAALMHVYARFSRFRIFADKKKCISCNVCTSVCHQGIDVMAFANKGKPLEDPECVRCSACVQMCPTGVLEFGQLDPASGRELGRDKLLATTSKD